jgi:hypothetical protein
LINLIISLVLKKLLKRERPCYKNFEFKNNPDVTRHGFIAQDVLYVKPEFVLGDGDKEDGTYGLDYDGILALTVKALQEATNRIEKLEKELENLKNRL